MKDESEYAGHIGKEHIKTYGQYFTDPLVAQFMCRWACRGANTMLDPAVGNSVFLLQTKQLYPQCRRTGYEIDNAVLDYFGNPSDSEIIQADYLTGDWGTKYDAIVANPPYGRFQSIRDRDRIFDTVQAHTGFRHSRCTNLYTLFLIKSLAQLSPGGRLAFLIPTEFMNAAYGTPVKQKLLSEHLVRGIIHFRNDRELFPDAVTTCCILLIDQQPKDTILFYTLDSKEELQRLYVNGTDPHAQIVSYENITADEKWHRYMENESRCEYTNLTDVAQYCTVARGVATGANDFFCLSRSRIEQLHLPKSAYVPCICRSADVKTGIFTEKDFDRLAAADQKVYLLNLSGKEAGEQCPALQNYIRYGEEKGFHEKYLPKHRSPWYAMEQKTAPPIWFSPNVRGEMKFVRNLAGIRSLTTFHSIFIRNEYEHLTDVIFCYFLTPTAQAILRENRKEMGNGLEKYQPGDIAHAKMLDLSVLTDEEIMRIRSLYQRLTLQREDPACITEAFSRVFEPHLRCS